MPIFSLDRHVPLRVAVVVLFAGGGFAAYHFLPIFQGRNALWTIAHNKCVPNQEAHRNPAPCVRVDLTHGVARGYVILKDIRGATQFLLIPTQRISGIESLALLAPDAPNYWAAAWQNRRFVSARAGRDLAWNMIGLAINSSAARSQDQLHIHIDCVRPDVRSLLAQHSAEIGTAWKKLPFALAGRHYIARRLAAADLETQDPFELLARSLAPGQTMAQETLAVVGTSFASGQNDFVLLAGPVDAAKNHHAHSEDLLDHRCAVAAMK
ncbi:CDP-diacylglycerol diphosphatase [Methylovirgula sp. HY1]|uniref:CDP-diacylglycerol diphosphatase n=1 Tax=Methylovirgula sp. HY1 TaxID=2822761 RepID=UPI001C5B2D9A|nr:CDP-diacylglycerol diphosphatase [Methylovirgula sp. HY1]QXX75094.1 CDP-diacylglycerol pyrophosphatase [Methylovirgula sp. HY1]